MKMWQLAMSQLNTGQQLHFLTHHLLNGHSIALPVCQSNQGKKSSLPFLPKTAPMYLKFKTL